MTFGSITTASPPTIDFIIIGAQKAGTTSLFEYLRRHPELHLPAGKEMPYFSDDQAYNVDWQTYLARTFPGADPSKRWGTATPHYMIGGVYADGNPPRTPSRSPSDERTVPRRIHQRLPNVRLLAILRDPIERALSHFRMAAMNGLEQRTFEEAVDELLRPDVLERSRDFPANTTGYVTWGEYGRILAGYLEVFSRDQLLVLFTTELEDEPVALLRRVYEHLGVAVDFVPDNLGTRYRQGADVRRLHRATPQNVESGLRRVGALRAIWHRLPEPSRRRILDRFTALTYTFDLWNRRHAPDRETSEQTVTASTQTTERLRAHFEPDSELLSTLLGLRLPWSG